MGNLSELHDQENNHIIAKWEASIGSTFAYKGFFGMCRLMSTDPIAVGYVLSHSDDYPKPQFIRDRLAAMGAGEFGVVTVEGDVHKRQRKILAPAFSAGQIKSFAPIILDKAHELRNIWMRTTQEAKAPHVDVLPWLARATLDVIGLSGFGYSFNSLSDEDNELANAYNIIFSTAREFQIMPILEIWFPILRKFHRENARMKHALDILNRIGLQLVHERRVAVEAELKSMPNPQVEDFSTDAKDDGKPRPRDLLSVLIRSDMACEPSQRMNVSEILCQISTFTLAGHETTASALTWCLYSLAKSPSSQIRLRTALLTIPRECPTLSDEISKLPYLEWVVRESLRVHAPVTNTMRTAAHDDEIPVLRPFVDRNGVTRRSIRVNKNDLVTIPIQAINRSKAIWGEDAEEFRPERWENYPKDSDANVIHGLYANILTFLSGNRGCIGYKFALLEIKIFIYVLLLDLEFSLDPSIIIEKTFNLVARPSIKSAPALGNLMPLIVRPASTPISTSLSSNDQ